MIKTDRIILSVEDVEFILKWRDENKDLVRGMDIPLKAVKLVFPESGYEFTAIASEGKFRFCINQNGRSLGNVEFERLGNGMCGISRDKLKGFGEEDKKTILTVYSSTMAFLLYGNSETQEMERETNNVQRAQKKASTNEYKKKQKGTTYILCRRGNTVQMAVRGSHRSPAMSFGVRGHFRHYKNGKVVWINEYVKGSGRKADKTYKLGGKRNEKK